MRIRKGYGSNYLCSDHSFSGLTQSSSTIHEYVINHFFACCLEILQSHISERLYRSKWYSGMHWKSLAIPAFLLILFLLRDTKLTFVFQNVGKCLASQANIFNKILPSSNLSKGQVTMQRSWQAKRPNP